MLVVQPMQKREGVCESVSLELQEGIGYCNIDSAVCYFLVAEQESNQRSRPKGRYEPKRPLWKPQPHLQPAFKNVPIFERLQLKILQSFLCRHPKIGTFSGVGWRSGGWGT